MTKTFIILLSFIPIVRLTAQCPDGTPPPCGPRRPAAVAAPALDPDRIAILPFRVAAADSMLGEGIAELVATEFSGGSPRAVHMGTVLNGWRRAGGGLRAPLPQPAQLRLARSMGAGLLVDGSVVGVGQRLTITASVVRSSDGRVRRAAPVSGSADSLDELTKRVVVGVMAAAGGEARTEERTRTTSSPEAMRAYLVGLAAYRRGELAAATEAFERALDIDSTFVLAVLRRLQIDVWNNVPLTGRWGRLAWSLRERLSRGDRALLEAFLGPRYPGRTPAPEWLAAAARATREAPESPDAWYQYGDLVFHGWSGEPDPVGHALALFERAYTLDSQALTLQHVAEAALISGDTAMLRRLDPAQFIGRHTLLAWMTAARLGDARTMAVIRRPETPWVGATIPLAGIWGTGRAETDELIELLVHQRRQNRTGFHAALVAQGRPLAATAFMQQLQPQPTSAFDLQQVAYAVFADADTAAAVAAMARIRSRVPADSMQAAQAECAKAQWALWRGLPLDADTAAMRRGGRDMCATLTSLTRAVRAGEPGVDARLAATDSVVRDMVFGLEGAGYEGLWLSRLWTARGDHRRALASARMRHEAFNAFAGTIGSLVAEGRLAVAAGDTAVARRALQRYLRMRGDPEPALIPQRDSVRAALAALERH